MVKWSGHWRAQRRALWMSASAVALVGMYRAACTVLVDASGNFVNDLLNSWVGRVGEWLVLAGVMTAYAVHLRRQACAHCPAASSVKPRRRFMRGNMPGCRNNAERLPPPTRRPRLLMRKESRGRARFA